MHAYDWIIILAGLGGIAWVNWYFFLAEQAGTAAAMAVAGTGGRQEVSVIVQGGYSPSTIRVAAGQPVRLTFDRRESSSCSEELVFPAFNIRRFLPENQRTTVDITPPSPGTYEFTCGMGMLHGRVIAE